VALFISPTPCLNVGEVVGGEVVGEPVGDFEGGLGEAEGALDGENVGEAVGALDGEGVGEVVGEAVGALDGEGVGEVVGRAVESVGEVVGRAASSTNILKARPQARLSSFVRWQQPLVPSPIGSSIYPQKGR